MTNRKVGIIGAGAVGATAAFSLAMTGTCNEIILYDIDSDIAIGKAIDIEQAISFSPSGTKVGEQKNIDMNNVICSYTEEFQTGSDREILL